MAHLAPVGGGQVLRGVLLASGAMTARVTAPAGADTKAAPDEGALLVEEPFDLLAVSFGGLEQALPEAAAFLRHATRIRLCWHTYQYKKCASPEPLP